MSEGESQDVEQLFAVDSDINVKNFKNIDEECWIDLFQNQFSTIIHQFQSFVNMRAQSLPKIHIINNTNFLPRQFDIFLLTLYNPLNSIFDFLTKIYKFICNRAQQLTGHVIN